MDEYLADLASQRMTGQVVAELVAELVAEVVAPESHSGRGNGTASENARVENVATRNDVGLT